MDETALILDRYRPLTELGGMLRTKKAGDTVNIVFWRFNPDTEEWEEWEADVVLGEIEGAR